MARPQYVVNAPFFAAGRYYEVDPRVPALLTFDGVPSRTWGPVNAEAQAQLAKLGVRGPLCKVPATVQVIE